MKTWKYKNYQIRVVGQNDWWKTNALNVSDAAKAFAYEYDRHAIPGLRLRDGFGVKIEVLLEGTKEPVLIKLTGKQNPEYKTEDISNA